MKITKRDAAEQQIDNAISLLFGDQIVSAVTLAGAAETSLLDNQKLGGALFDSMKSQGEARTGISQKELADKHFNKLRNWLKHQNADELEADVQQEDGVIMILRAYTKFTSVYGESATTTTMRDFELWFRKHYGHWLQFEE